LNEHTDLCAWNLLLNDCFRRGKSPRKATTGVGKNIYVVEQDERLILSVTCMCCWGWIGWYSIALRLTLRT